MLEELLVDLVEYGITGGVHLAVDMHRITREEWASISSKSLKRAVVLPVPGAPAEGIDRPRAVQAGACRI